MHMTIRMAALAAAAMAVSACNTPPQRDTYLEIEKQMANALAKSGGPGAPGDPVSNALLPPVAQLAEQLPKARAALDERFNVAFNNVPAPQFFRALVAGTRYNMLVSPEVSGVITANLKDVTLVEALDAVRELYGYDYKIEGNRISIRPLTMQTRMFQVNYLSSKRQGSSNLRVSSNSVASAGTSSSGNSSTGGVQNGNGSTGSNDQNNNNGGNSGGSSSQRDSASVTTRSESDFWTDLKQSLEAIVGSGKDGRSVVISPQSGVIVIRAMPDDLRNIEMYLKATQLSVDRQVILEAKILEVELNTNFQSGINWAAFGSRISGGFLQPGTTLLPNRGTASAQASSGAAGITATAGATLGASANAAGSLFGLAFQSSNFAALISFLESQGTVHVLSSPRIATLNNQKAVLKIGTDEFFVTGVSTTTSTSSSGNGTVSPSVTLQPFFSGVVLDVTPQIDERGNIILHVHPSVSQVSTVSKDIDLGTAGSLSLPLASSNTSEMDSIVRGSNGNVVALGGLMRQYATGDRSQVPGIGNVPLLGNFFRNTGNVMQKRELVVLIKPTVVEASSDWNQNLLEAKGGFNSLDPASIRTIGIEAQER